MPGLAASRWAPGARRTTGGLVQAREPFAPLTSNIPRETTSTKSGATHQQLGTRSHGNTDSCTTAASELQRFLRIVRRLKWKIPDLARGYREAVDGRLGNVHRAYAEEAALMFKLDFFEYYMLIERALVHLLGVFGITVSRGFEKRHIQTLRGDQDRRLTNVPDPNGSCKPDYSHRFHANVLEALDNPENPLYAAWKKIDEVEDVASVAGTNAAAPLESYNLEQIITTIFNGFEIAYLIAQEYVNNEQRTAHGGVIPEDTGGLLAGLDQVYTDEEEWKFYVDAMDWESV
ncbi:hypothetical protein DL546_001324 [Coniochaeta pulveracea]|uniref:Uncharacterized protein n=1 Tax=Coniochaeta pulveracea TaxID=177199 RepID=A0A420Y214_9PEZI|nr:hypothetical protein DL546_001324 [Coniochaeta pulveracea]